MELLTEQVVPGDVRGLNQWRAATVDGQLNCFHQWSIITKLCSQAHLKQKNRNVKTQYYFCCILFLELESHIHV